MHTAPTHPRKVLVRAASTRTGSVNQALARHIADRLDIGAPVEILDGASVGPDGELAGIDHAELTRFVSQATTERSAA